MMMRGWTEVDVERRACLDLGRGRMHPDMHLCVRNIPLLFTQE